MPNIPASVGYFTLTGRHTVGGADSTDPDEIPNAVGSNGRVVFTPQLVDARPIVAVAEDEAISVVQVPCRLGDGYIYPPADGITGGVEPGTQGVRLIASRQAATQPESWWWRADFIPDEGEPWLPFSLVFQTVPGQELTIAQLIAQSPPVMTGTTYQQLWFIVSAFPTDPVLLADLPDGFRPGIDLLVNSTTQQYAEVY